eukprot:CAMPEP_0180564150 /NCGR_PEP_ID=MMETSP1037_2-20121125/4858_1 /TAXON_ID=632150 /ORGANISM="Azadinium spinosum, Strain 3D9" /LENGTH=298 /DNA_ID=CAMNT_0022581033 /DNA_START=1 /DNA_END=894 /DNA_ORIENTATION=-
MRAALACLLCWLGASPRRSQAEDAADDTPKTSVNFCDPVQWDFPIYCPQGRTHWPADQLHAALPEFASMYARRPIRKNMWGMNTNHAFSLWYTVRALKPKYVIESGVHRGQSTWLLRQAAGPEAWIYSLDPKSESNLLYRDYASGRTRYFMGESFTDLAAVNWTSLIPIEDRTNTLVMLDDHMACTTRVRDLLASGFVHLWYDDNWKYVECYSFNAVCSPVPEGIDYVPFYDDMGRIETLITVQEHVHNVKYLVENIEVYFEFPPLLDGCSWDPRQSLSNESELVALGLPSISEDEYY